MFEPGNRAVTADTALRLARYFGASEQFRLDLQDDYDLKAARAKIAATLRKIGTTGSELVP